MYDLYIPKRTMFFMGPQRCGKTTMLQTAVKFSAEAGQKVLLVGLQIDIDLIMTEAELYGRNLHVDHLPLRTDEATAKYLKPGDYDVVAFVGNTVFMEPGHVRIYNEPSTEIRKFFWRLSEPTAHIPRLYFETHYQGTERDVAFG